MLCAHLRDSNDKVTEWCRSSGGPDITDRSAVFDAVLDADPDVIFHLAAQAHVPTAWEDPIGTLRTNVEGTQNVLDATHATGKAPRVILVTSAEAYGPVDESLLPIREQQPLAPSNPYAASKAAAEALAIGAHRGRGLDVIRMRSFNHFGPGQSTNFASSAFAHRIAKAVATGQDTIEVGDLTARRDFCDVRDVVRAYRCAAIHGESGAVYNVCSGIDRSIEEVALALAAESGAGIVFKPSEALFRPSDSPIIVGSAELLHNISGWTPEISFEQTISDIYADAVQRLQQCESGT